MSDWSLRDQSEALSHTVYSLACAPGGEWLISGDANGRVAVRETKGLAKVAEVTNVHYGEANVWSVAVADSPLDILSGNSDGRVRLWRANGPTWSADNAKAWTVAATSDADAAVNHTINSVSYSRKRGWVAAGGDGESVELYDRALKRVRSLRDHDGTVWFVSFDPGGSRLAYGGTDRILRLFDLDVIDRNLAVDTPAALYQESETKTGLTVRDGKIVPLLPAEDLRR